VEILLDRLFVFAAATRGVDILDPEQEPAAVPFRCALGGKRRKGVAQMQKSGWTWREAGDNHGPVDIDLRKVAS
jgi:hypothetical protein